LRRASRVDLPAIGARIKALQPKVSNKRIVKVLVDARREEGKQARLRRGKPRWDSLSFCHTGEALNRVSRQIPGPIDPAAA
jgi:hypothetical protein